MDLGLSGKTVLVTGATRGIGREIARAYATEGARVALTYHTDRSAAEAIADELGAARDQAFAVPYSLDDPAAAAQATAAVVQRWGALDVLVANAVRRPPRRDAGVRFEDVDDEQWLPVVHDNLGGTIRLTRLAVAEMRRRTWGRIVLLSSHNALGGGSGQEFLGAAKAALHGFARSLAWDVGKDGILVNVVCPGLTTTADVLSRLPAPVRERETAGTPTGRLSAPEDVAQTVVFLGSAANGNTTGETVTVSGGR
ncbi:SDR family NAD(P)-dependent oxidoreductase [Micromonospora sp. NPDC047548]|uniref:SDR family NAD(P)-dependent oxidoreductase n=1 Tax=Micromonospora sp. NPDC047548 TaxID=3155624 RepID=UPI00340B2FF4